MHTGDENRTAAADGGAKPKRTHPLCGECVLNNVRITALMPLLMMPPNFVQVSPPDALGIWESEGGSCHLLNHSTFSCNAISAYPGSLPHLRVIDSYKHYP